jgi:uncharacterized membrane protein YgdD (TMEM256/DUF423 family)
MARILMMISALAGAVAVGLGAFGAHYIKDLLSPTRFAVYETGARYLLVHAVVLLVTTYWMRKYPSGILSAAGFAFLLGMIGFSGSLLLLAVTGIRILGAIAPIGGAGFLAGWVLLAIAAWKLPVDAKEIN